jgi:MYXO-CTERM domain-containing protein
MPEVKTLVGSAVQGYTSPDTAVLAARESIWLSLIPATWMPGAQTTPGSATDKPGTNPDGTGPLPRVTAPGTSTDPNAETPTPVVPGGASPEPPEGPGSLPQDSAGCGCSTTTPGSTSGNVALTLLVALGIVAMRRGKRAGKEEQ